MNAYEKFINSKIKNIKPSGFDIDPKKLNAAVSLQAQTEFSF